MSDVLYVPRSILVATWLAFQEAASLQVESTVRWAGPALMRNSDEKVVTTLINPYQRVSAGFFEIPHGGTRAMGAALASAALMNFAQVHTHPSSWVDHSGWDDDHAYSSANGALSIVWPHYGASLPRFDDWGVHERLNGAWARINGFTAARRVRVVPDVITLRGPLEIIPVEEIEKTEDLRFDS